MPTGVTGHFYSFLEAPRSSHEALKQLRNELFLVLGAGPELPAAAAR